MKKFFITFLLVVACAPVAGIAQTAFTDDYNDQLYYTSPASIWEETLPLGNGRLGIMPDGGIDKEHIVLNEISLWSGMETDYGNLDAAGSLPAIRQLLFEGKNREAQELMYKSFVPRKPQLGGTYGNYQLLANLDMDYSYPTIHNGKSTIEDVENYRRWLDFPRAIAYTSFRKDGVNFRREYFTSRDKDIIVIHLLADRNQALNFSVRISRPERGTVSLKDNTLFLDGALDSGKPGKDGMNYRIALRMITLGGKQQTSDRKSVV